jgi:hypothetical protein
LELQPQAKLTFNLLQQFPLKIGVSIATSPATATEIDLQLQELPSKIGVSFSSSTSTSREIDLQSTAGILLEDRGFVCNFNSNSNRD